ncbi:MAG: hypothetical protein O3B09_03855, partial [Proteobacteria bacterium]|nr:hypothetical protein [Pseudomonadota bacterium]
MTIKSPNNKPHQINRGLIMLKSSVIALGLVLFILVIAFVIAKNKKSASVEVTVKKKDICAEQIIKIDAQIEKFEVVGKHIFLLTKPAFKNGAKTQQLIKLSNDCGEVISSSQFVIR